jgi:NAD(P)-dependent dehydrogenase (short-subunit alcohol dehydrogenase family)
MSKLTGKVAVVTGASKGIGAAIAKKLAEDGASVVVNYASSKTGADAVVAAIAAKGGKAVAVQGDVSKSDEAKGIVDAAIKQFGKLDILVNNAGGGFTNLAIDVPEQEFDETLNINLKATFFAAQAAAKIMIRQGGGRIINMSSQAGYAALPTESIYCASKAAVSHLTKCLAVEWGKFNITVNAVAPTFIKTPGTEEALADPAFRADTIERIAALHRIGEPVEVSGAVVFLASPAASLITGHTILIDGGWTAR